MTLAKKCGLESDLDTLRRMMRHESIDTTVRCYLTASPDRIEAAERKIDRLFSDARLEIQWE